MSGYTINVAGTNNESNLVFSSNSGNIRNNASNKNSVLVESEVLKMKEKSTHYSIVDESGRRIRLLMDDNTSRNGLLTGYIHPNRVPLANYRYEVQDLIFTENYLGFVYLKTYQNLSPLIPSQYETYGNIVYGANIKDNMKQFMWAENAEASSVAWNWRSRYGYSCNGPKGKFAFDFDICSNYNINDYTFEEIFETVKNSYNSIDPSHIYYDPPIGEAIYDPSSQSWTYAVGVRPHTRVNYNDVLTGKKMLFNPELNQVYDNIMKFDISSIDTYQTHFNLLLNQLATTSISSDISHNDLSLNLVHPTVELGCLDAMYKNSDNIGIIKTHFELLLTQLETTSISGDINFDHYLINIHVAPQVLSENITFMQRMFNRLLDQLNSSSIGTNITVTNLNTNKIVLGHTIEQMITSSTFYTSSGYGNALNNNYDNPVNKNMSTFNFFPNKQAVKMEPMMEKKLHY